jgi:hypothetical protein
VTLSGATKAALGAATSGTVTVAAAEESPAALVAVQESWTLAPLPAVKVIEVAGLAEVSVPPVTTQLKVIPACGVERDAASSVLPVEAWAGALIVGVSGAAATTMDTVAETAASAVLVATTWKVPGVWGAW